MSDLSRVWFSHGHFILSVKDRYFFSCQISLSIMVPSSQSPRDTTLSKHFGKSIIDLSKPALGKTVPSIARDNISCDYSKIWVFSLKQFCNGFIILLVPILLLSVVNIC
jgi:hypothetical protein